MDRPSSPSNTVEDALAQLTQARYPIIYNTMIGISYLDIHEPFHRHLMNTPFSDPQIGLLALLISDLCNISSHKEIRRGVLSLCQTHFEQCIAVTPSCCLSNVAFVGHLYNLGVLAETVVQRMLNYLLEERSKRTRLVAMACTLLATTGRRLDRIMVQDSSWSERLGELQSKTSDYKVKEMVEYSLKLVNGHSDAATAQSALQSVSVYLMSYLHNTIKKNNITSNGTTTPVPNSSSSPTSSEAESKSGAMSFRRSASKSFLSLRSSKKSSDLDIPTTPSSRSGRIKEELSPKSRKESTFKSNRSESSDICLDPYVPTVSELRQLSRADLRRLLMTIEGLLEEDSPSPRPSSGNRSGSGIASESPIAQRWAAWEASQPFAVVDAEDF